jgi:ubiquinone/menaquinone biosynthesis C-methylase UbiE
MIIDPQKIEEKKLIELISPKGKKILEIGCGQGDMAIILAPLCHQYIGIDVDQNSITKAQKIAKNISNLTFFVRSGDQTKLQDESIDTVLMHFCLHEVPLQKQGLVLMEIHRVLKNHGQLLIVDPTEPPGQVQSLFNAGYQFSFFHHSTVVKHSIKVISQAISKKLYKVKEKIRLKIDFSFKDLEELQNFIQNDFGEIDWNSKNQKILVNKLLKITKNKTKNINLIDDLTITNLIKTN